LEEIGARVSRSATGNPAAKAQAESVFTTGKREAVSLTDDQRVADAEAPRGPFLADVSTTQRLHSSLGYLPPAEFEAAQGRSMLEVPLPLDR
jgi:transposase InsO family protein